MLRALQRLAILRWLGAAYCAFAMLCASTATASALEGVQTKTRVWGFELAEHHAVGLSCSASPRTRISRPRSRNTRRTPHMPQGGRNDRYGASRFSQDSVKGSFRNGTTLNDAISALRAGGAEAAAKYRPIRLFERNGALYTLDNRRLLVFSQAGQQVPFRMATEAEIAKEFTGKFTTTAAQGWGQFITVRP